MNYTSLDGVIYRHFDHLYSVSVCGRILRKLEPFKPKVRKDGYLYANRSRLVHRMVAICWLDKPIDAMHVHHKNHKKDDNRADNLEWLTPSQHRSKHPEAGRAPMPDSAKEKLRHKRTGTKSSESTKEKQRQAMLKLGISPPSWSGKKHTQETKDKMRLSHPKNIACIVFGNEYPSFSKAGEALGIRPLTLRKRCYSKGFQDYKVKS